MAASFIRKVVVSTLALTLTACNLSGSGANASQEMAAGKALYDEYCASCHGLDGEGQPDWKVPGPDGVYPAPPHTADGHTWHHADQQLLQIIANGGAMPNNNMPGFSDQLTEEEMTAILAYIKTFWREQEIEFQQQVTEQYIESDND